MGRKKTTLFLVLSLSIALMGLHMPLSSLQAATPKTDHVASPCHETAPTDKPDAQKAPCPMTCCQVQITQWTLPFEAKTPYPMGPMLFKTFHSHETMPPTAPPRSVS